MSMIFTPKYVHPSQLFDPCLMIKAIDYLADKKAEGGLYA
jgi:hypothetical protein